MPNFPRPKPFSSPSRHRRPPHLCPSCRTLSAQGPPSLPELHPDAPGCLICRGSIFCHPRYNTTLRHSALCCSILLHFAPSAACSTRTLLNTSRKKNRPFWRFAGCLALRIPFCPQQPVVPPRTVLYPPRCITLIIFVKCWIPSKSAKGFEQPALDPTGR